jgi:hypothetical protein
MKLGRADLLVGLDARQRVPAAFMAPMRDLGTEEASLAHIHGLTLLADSVDASALLGGIYSTGN